jgi:hypothetical protein
MAAALPRCSSAGFPRGGALHLRCWTDGLGIHDTKGPRSLHLTVFDDVLGECCTGEDRETSKYRDDCRQYYLSRYSDCGLSRSLGYRFGAQKDPFGLIDEVVLAEMRSWNHAQIRRARAHDSLPEVMLAIGGKWLFSVAGSASGLPQHRTNPPTPKAHRRQVTSSQICGLQRTTQMVTLKPLCPPPRQSFPGSKNFTCRL